MACVLVSGGEGSANMKPSSSGVRICTYQNATPVAIHDARTPLPRLGASTVLAPCKPLASPIGGAWYANSLAVSNLARCQNDQRSSSARMPPGRYADLHHYLRMQFDRVNGACCNAHVTVGSDPSVTRDLAGVREWSRHMKASIVTSASLSIDG